VDREGASHNPTGDMLKELEAKVKTLRKEKINRGALPAGVFTI